MGLSLYERAYLCGGPDRAARTALLSLHATASVRVAGSPPYRVQRAHGKADHLIEAALLSGLPSSGLPVRLVMRKLADSPEVTRYAVLLLDKKLLHRSFRGLVRPTRAGVRLRERLAAQASTDELARFAALGTPPEELRPVLAELPPEAVFPIKLPRHKIERGYDDRGDYNPPLRTPYGA